MRLFQRFIQYGALLLAIIFFIFFLLEFFPPRTEQPASLVLEEEYDPALQKINSIAAALAYCDSISLVRLEARPGLDPDSLFVNTVSTMTRKRFFHGDAEYGIGNNFMALFLQPLMVNKTVTPMVAVEAILKQPKAICGQQSRVLAEIVRERQVPVKKVLFDHPLYGGHYAIEIYYQQAWHLFDPDKEPDHSAAASFERPSTEYLQQHPAVLKKLYNKTDPVQIESLFSTAKIYAYQAQEGPQLLLYQRITQLLSYCAWLLFFVLYLWMYRINHLKQPVVVTAR